MKRNPAVVIASVIILFFVGAVVTFAILNSRLSHPILVGGDAKQFEHGIYEDPNHPKYNQVENAAICGVHKDHICGIVNGVFQEAIMLGYGDWHVIDVANAPDNSGILYSTELTNMQGCMLYFGLLGVGVQEDVPQDGGCDQNMSWAPNGHAFIFERNYTDSSKWSLYVMLFPGVPYKVADDILPDSSFWGDGQTIVYLTPGYHQVSIDVLTGETYGG